MIFVKFLLVNSTAPFICRGYGEDMLDLVILQIVLDPLSYEVIAIVGDDCMWDSILGYDIVLDEFLCHCGSNCFVGSRFYLFSEVVDGH